MSESPELLVWTRAALEALYDLPFLRRLARAASAGERFADERALQNALLNAIKQLKPPLNVSTQSPAWRVYNVLNLRYVQGLPQPEAAARLNIGLRQLRREQRRAVEAVAGVLFDGGAEQRPFSAPEPGLGEFAPRTAEAAPEFTHLDELLHDCLRIFAALLERQAVQVVVTSPASLPAVRANRMILRQMLISAIDWQIQGATGAAAAINLAIQNSQIVIRFLKPGAAGDRGQLPDALITAERLADLLGAVVECRADEGGEALIIHLPASHAECVLMIDDNPHAVQLVQRFLQQSDDFYLVPVTDARNALKQALVVHPACIILDVMMPERDGWELLTLFRAHPDTAAIPIVVSSVLKESDLARALGASEVLTKPFTATQLLAVLKDVIARSHRSPAARSA